MADGFHGARRARPVADVPPPALADGAAVAHGWLVALAGSRPLAAAVELPTAAIARDGPALCAVLLRAVGSDRALAELDGRRLAALTGASTAADVATAIGLLREAAWRALLREVHRDDGDLVAALAARLGAVCDELLRSALSAAGATAEGAGRQAAQPWEDAVQARLRHHGADGAPFSLLTVEVDDAERLLAADADGGVAAVLARAQDALRGELRCAGVLVGEHPGRLWAIGPALDGERAAALARRLRDAAASVVLHGAPLAVAVGVATCPTDGTDAAALLERAEIGVFAARAAGVPLAGATGSAD